MNATCVYDFTIGSKFIDSAELNEILNKHCKKWVFQEELGEKSAYQHYQGRFSLKIKKRPNECKTLLGLKEIHLSITSNENRNNDFYVMKEETRICGPWSDKDKPTYIPRQIREIVELYPWQKYIKDHTDDWDTRTINCIIDKTGNIGKSSLAGYLSCYKLGRMLPPLNDIKDIMRIVMDTPKSRCYLIDMPKAMNKDRLYQFYAGIETLKNGYCYDDRYHFKEEYFDCPNIWIFTNKIPDTSLLSIDRWKFWKVSPLKKLVSLKN